MFDHMPSNLVAIIAIVVAATAVNLYLVAALGFGLAIQAFVKSALETTWGRRLVKKKRRNDWAFWIGLAGVAVFLILRYVNVTL